MPKPKSVRAKGKGRIRKGIPLAVLASRTDDSTDKSRFNRFRVTVADAATALSQEPEVSSLEKLHNSESLEDLINGTPPAAPHNPIDASSSTLPSSCEKVVMHTAGSASPLASQDLDISSFGELVITTSREEESIATGLHTVQHNTINCSAPLPFSLASPIFAREASDWYESFFIRMDRGGSFHTYPYQLGGPFQSLQEADDAINNHLCSLRKPAMCEPDENNLVDFFVIRYLYYPDGTPRKGPNSPGHKNRRDLHDLVQALLDQYNDHHNLCEDVAHELKGLLNYEWILEEETAYYHFNFTTKTKRADKEYLFFAEVSRTKIKRDWVVTCCCVIESFDNGCCNGCGPEIKHPNNTRAYTGGHEEHINGCLPLGGDTSSDTDDEDEEALKERLRIMFQ